MEPARGWLVDDVHGERLVSGRLHQEFESGGHQNGDAFVQFGGIATGRDFSLAAENIIDFLLALKPGRRGRGTGSQPAIGEKVGRTQHGALLRRSEVVAANKDVTQYQRAVLEAGQRPLPVADKQVDSPILRFSLPGVLDELWPGIGINSVDRVFRAT